MCSRVIGSAHRLTERNNLVKFNENQPKGSGDMEMTRNSRVNPLTLTCKLDFELRVRLAPLNRFKPSSKIFY